MMKIFCQQKIALIIIYSIISINKIIAVKKESHKKISIINNPHKVAMLTESPIKCLGYECYRWPYYLSLPLMWLLTFYVMNKKKAYKLLGLSGPKTNTLFFDGLGKSCRKVKDYAASWKAMDIIYNHPFKMTLSVGGILDEFYWRSQNCQALRNRYKLVKHLLKNTTPKFGKEIRLASLACGGGQAILETIAEFKSEGIIIKAILIDINGEALKRAEKTAEKYGIKDQIETFKADLSKENSVLKDFKPQIVEMLGFLDYVEDNQAISFLKNINDSLDEKGVIITCNINPNPEQYFIKWVINWPMVYRKPSQLIDIAKSANFKDCKIILEPLKIHGLLVAKK